MLMFVARRMQSESESQDEAVTSQEEEDSPKKPRMTRQVLQTEKPKTNDNHTEEKMETEDTEKASGDHVPTAPAAAEKKASPPKGKLSVLLTG